MKRNWLAAAGAIALAGVACGPGAQGGEQARDEQMSGGEEAFPGRTGPAGSAVVATVDGPRRLDYVVIDGWAVHQGDIILGRTEDLARGSAALERAPLPAPESVGRANSNARWPGGIVPFEIDSSFTQAQLAQVNAAIGHWNDITPYWFKNRSGESDYLRIVSDQNNGCVAYGAGRQGGKQEVHLASGCSTGNAIHELGHVVGLYHEQTRSDRGSFITVNAANIQMGFAAQFQTYSSAGIDGQDMFAFDFNSIMLYGSFAFSGNGLPTMVKTDGTTFNAQRNGLSEEDVAGAVRLLVRDPGQVGKELVNVNSGKCMDVAWGSTTNGQRIQQFSCHGFGNQQFRKVYPWWFLPYFALVNVDSGKCLDIPNGSTASGTQINQFTCNYNWNQLWYEN